MHFLKKVIDWGRPGDTWAGPETPKIGQGILEARFREAFVKLCCGRLWHAQLQTGVLGARKCEGIRQKSPDHGHP